jgi:predicted nucleotidyltransferase
MNELIIEKLNEIEKERGVHILYACESGSRAWGFPSPDSDYDVRFIYAHDVNWHLSLHDKKDTIDIPINDDLDIGGWEIKKALNLLMKSNPPLLEWIQSPIVYKSNTNFLAGIRELAASFYSPIATMHHYLSMSKKYISACAGDQIKLKKYFYALRTTIACSWIREKGTMPDIKMSNMFSVVDPMVISSIEELVAIKALKNEDYVHHIETIISQFLNSELIRNELIAKDLPSGNGTIKLLDSFFLNVVKGEV